MIRKDKIATLVITLSIAVAIGHFVQNSPAEAARLDTVEGTQAMFTPSLQSGLPVAPLVELGSVRTTFSQYPATVRLASASGFSDIIDAFDRAAHESSRCPLALSTLVESKAMVRLSLSAPCYANSTATIAHGALHFSQALDAEGTFETLIPAMEKSAVFSVSMVDGTTAETRADVFTVDAYERTALEWSQDLPLNLHAFLGGASFGELGHVWVESEKTAAVEADLYRLGTAGSEGTYVQVFSKPASLFDTGETVDIVIEAEVTQATCAKQLHGYLVESDGIGTPSRDQFTIHMPDCHAIGEYIQLKKRPAGTTLSRN